jgi:hexosaminidase
VQPDPAADFTIHSGTAIRTTAAAIGELLAGALRSVTGYAVPVSRTAGAIVLLLDERAEDERAKDERAEDERTEDERAEDEPAELDARAEDERAELDGGPEAYDLDITSDLVTVRATTEAGLFAAVQTLFQLLPAQAEQVGDVTLPGGRIIDRPRFGYRSVMLDVARHFWTVDEVKAYIDAIAQFKINHLHLHLTDDQGWRLEIAGWPDLTEVSAGPGTGVRGEGGGFYTREDYTDLVAYAASRFVTIVPEIDMPGHTNAAQVAYPELTCDGVAVPPRTDTEVGYSSLCVGMERTYAFVEDVIREVAALTPGPYLHIGGDEAQATTAEDYRTFMTRVLPLVEKYGKRAIGWHEMAAVDLPEYAVPQFWRIEPADDGTARAAANGSKVIMSPADRSYLDMKYDESSPLGLDWAGVVSVERSYDWDPATRLPGVGEEALLGVEAPLWAETLRTLTDVETMTFPRLPAIAEIGWSAQADRDWVSFRRRVAAFAPRWTAQGVAFYRSPEIDWAD